MRRSQVLEAVHSDPELCELLGLPVRASPVVEDSNSNDDPHVGVEGFLEFIRQFVSNLATALSRTADGLE